MRHWLPRLVTLIVLSAIVPRALASDNGADKYRDYTPEQIKAIPDAERQKSVPVMYIFATQKSLAPDGHLAMAMDLNRLMYPAVSDYAVAIKMFQGDIGDQPTGVLTVSQIYKLGLRAEYQKLAPIFFHAPYFSSLSDSSATVMGTWKIVDDKIAWPINRVTISCYRDQTYCERRMIYLMLPGDDGWFPIYSLHEEDREFFRVTRWSNQLIDATPLNEGGKCRAVTLNLNFATKEFFEISRNAGGDCDVLGWKMPKLDKPRISQIVNGKEIIKQEFQDIQKKAHGFLASTFRAQVEKVTKSNDAK